MCHMWFPSVFLKHFHSLMKRENNSMKWKERGEKKNCKSIRKGWRKEWVSYAKQRNWPLQVLNSMWCVIVGEHLAVWNSYLYINFPQTPPPLMSTEWGMEIWLGRDNSRKYEKYKYNTIIKEKPMWLMACISILFSFSVKQHKARTIMESR